MTDETRFESETGGAKEMKLLRFDQIPAGPMAELAARYGLGSTKYAQKNGLDNWRNGYPFSLSMAALERHYYAFKNGEDYDATIYAEAGLLADGEHPLYDEEGKLRPGVTHLSAVVWHCFFLMHHLVENPHLDDRPSTVLRRNSEAKDDVALATNAELALEWIGEGRSESDVEERTRAILNLRSAPRDEDFQRRIVELIEREDPQPTAEHIRRQERSSQRMAKIRERLPQAIAEELAEDDLKLADVYPVVGTTTLAELTPEEMDAEESALIKNWGPAAWTSDGSRQGAVGLYQFMPQHAYPIRFVTGNSRVSPAMQSVMDTLKKRLAVLYPEAEQAEHSEWLRWKAPDDGTGTVTLKLKDVDPETMRLAYGGPIPEPEARTEAEVEALQKFDVVTARSPELLDEAVADLYAKRKQKFEVGTAVWIEQRTFTLQPEPLAGRVEACMPQAAGDGRDQYLVKIVGSPWHKSFETVHEICLSARDQRDDVPVATPGQIQDEALKNAVQQSLDRD